MGSGKTTIGSMLSQSLNYDFVDTDQLIESQQKLMIADIFEQKGEMFFRDFEHDLLKNLMISNTIVASGGGLPFYKNNWDLISQLGSTVFLNNSIDVLISRLNNNSGVRSKFLNPDSFRLLYKQRLNIYKKSNHIINCNGLKKEEVVQKILSFW